MSSTSFQKKARAKTLNIAGAKPSLHNNQLLVSSGIPSLDNLIGGGIAVGTVVLIEEDTFGSYSRLMLKYFLAEGVMCRHGLFLAGADSKPDDIIKELPGPLLVDPGSQPSGKAEDDEHLKIAWRYQHMPQVQSAPSGSSKFGNYYDLTKTMDPQLLDGVKMVLHDGSTDTLGGHTTTTMRPSYTRLLQSIKSEIDNGQYSTSAPSQQRNILRIGIHSLGSPMWGESGGMDINHHATFDPSLCRFLIGLRSLLRQAFAACVITVPTHLFQDVAFTRRIQSVCDTVLHLESFAGSDKEKNPAFKEYHGLFNVVKLPRLNCLTCHMPDTLDLAFKLRRKKFMIEKLHLPPELSETASRGDQEDPVRPAKKTVPCGSTSGSSTLDF